jgi:phosphopantetheinyl transferase
VTSARPTLVSEPTRVLRVAAAGPEELAGRLAADDAALVAMSGPAGTPAVGEGPCRLGLVNPTSRRLALARSVSIRAAEGTGPTAWRGPRDVWFTAREPLAAVARSVAFVFPGLEADFRPALDDVAAHFGFTPARGGTAGVGEHAAGVLSVGRLLAAALDRLGVEVGAMAGQSIGEWSAAACAGLRSADQLDAELARWRAAFHCPEVDYAVLGCGVDRALGLLDGAGPVVLSHDNSPRQVIVCGPPDAVAELAARTRGAGVITQVLSFRSGFHTPMFEPYLGPYREAAERLVLSPSRVPVWSSTTAQPYPSDPEAVRDLFLRNLVEPVLFRPTVEQMYAAGTRVFVQVGYGQSVSLIADVLGDRDHLAVAAAVRGTSGLTQLLRLATAVWVEGGEPRFDALVVPEPVAPGSAVREPAAPGSVVPEPAVPGSAVREPAVREPAVREPAGPDSVALEPVAPRSDDSVSLGPEAAQLLPARPPSPALGPDLLPEPGSPDITEPAATLRHTIRFGTAFQPWLADHAFYRQRPGWPDERDLRPIVPATTMIRLMTDLAEESAPGLRAVAVRNVRLRRWIVAAPPVDVQVRVVPAGPGAVTVELGDSACGTVELAVGYPTVPVPAAPDLGEQTPEISAERVYQERIMFHGPAFQGLVELLGVGERTARAAVRVPSAPGALLDNVGQLIGVWLSLQPGEATAAYPAAIERIEFYRPEPIAGERVEAGIRISRVSREAVEADGEVCVDGTPAVRITGWRDRRVLLDQAVEPAFRFAERHTQGVRRPGGWVLVTDRWPDVASRDLIAGSYLGAAERAEHERTKPQSRRGHLLGRIAVKDAVRHLLWSQGGGPLFPAEVEVVNEPSGRPRVRGAHGLELPPLDVSLSHCREVAVALCRPAGRGIGIDVEEIVPRDQGALAFALTDHERRLLGELAQRGGEPPDLWFARFWTAKEAVGKAEGTGLGGWPRGLEVVSASPSTLHLRLTGKVAANGDRRYQVRCTRVGNPTGLPAREYVVAWTTGWLEA